MKKSDPHLSIHTSDWMADLSVGANTDIPEQHAGMRLDDLGEGGRKGGSTSRMQQQTHNQQNDHVNMIYKENER